MFRSQITLFGALKKSRCKRFPYVYEHFCTGALTGRRGSTKLNRAYLSLSTVVVCKNRVSVLFKINVFYQIHKQKTNSSKKNDVCVASHVSVRSEVCTEARRGLGSVQVLGASLQSPFTRGKWLKKGSNPTDSTDSWLLRELVEI